MIPITKEVGRRGVLRSVAVAGAVAASGCTAFANWIGDKVLGHVNLFNETSSRLDGTIVIDDPDGETVLDDTFESQPSEDDADENGTDEEDGADVYEDVWTGSGTYEVSVTLADGSEVDDTSNASESVDIDDPDEQMLAVVFGSADFDRGIGFATGTKLTEFQENAGE